MCYATYAHSLTENSVRSKTGVNSTTAYLLQESRAKPIVNIAQHCLSSLVTQYCTLMLEYTCHLFFLQNIMLTNLSTFPITTQMHAHLQALWHHTRSVSVLHHENEANKCRDFVPLSHLLHIPSSRVDSCTAQLVTCWSLTTAKQI
jgi:hypothetical protein